jgi:predicted DNA-binding transcriptional regulator AlpA
MAENVDAIRVLSRSETIRTVGLSDRTWDRLEERGEGPPKTRISKGRIGYRVCDLKEWLDRRRESSSPTRGTPVPGNEEYKVATSENGRHQR